MFKVVLSTASLLRLLPLLPELLLLLPLVMSMLPSVMQATATS